jgi:hypothetical protein
MKPEERLAWNWVASHGKAYDDARGSDDVMFIRYEDVCSAPTALTMKMFEFCGLPWDEQTERFLTSSTRPNQQRRGSRPSSHPHSRRGYFGLVRDPLQAATAWRLELEPDEIERINAILQRSSLAGLYPSE